jgi:hypothetical protein
MPKGPVFLSYATGVNFILPWVNFILPWVNLILPWLFTFAVTLVGNRQNVLGNCSKIWVCSKVKIVHISSRTCLDNVLNHCSLELAVLIKTTELPAIAPHNYLVYNTSQCKLPPPPTQKLPVFTSQHCILIKIAGMRKYLVLSQGLFIWSRPGGTGCLTRSRT